MADFATILQDLDALNTVVSSLPAALDGVAADITAMQTEIQSLKDQLAAGSNVTQEQLDSLSASLQNMRGNLQTSADRLNALDLVNP